MNPETCCITNCTLLMNFKKCTWWIKKFTGIFFSRKTKNLSERTEKFILPRNGVNCSIYRSKNLIWRHSDLEKEGQRRIFPKHKNQRSKIRGEHSRITTLYAFSSFWLRRRQRHLPDLRSQIQQSHRTTFWIKRKSLLD